MPHWWNWNKASEDELTKAQNTILEHAEQASSAIGEQVKLTSHTVEVGENNDDFIHFIKCEPVMGANKDNKNPPIVMLHGYGGGSALFVNNLVGLCQVSGTSVYAVDLLGCGLSSRPKWNAKTTEEATEFFLNSFEDFRKKKNLDNFVLLGHSMGGYLAAEYTIQNPGPVEHLVLASPVGLPERPPPVETDQPAKIPMVWRAARKMWENGTTPQTFVRLGGPWGRRLVERFVDARFEGSGRSLGLLGLDKDSDAVVDYLYHLSAIKPSGEKALSLILEPGAWGKRPLVNRLHLLNTVPVSFLYGEHDWMSPTTVKEHRHRFYCHSLDIVPDAGHHLYVNNWKNFNKVVYDVVFGSRSPLSKDGIIDAMDITLTTA